LKGSLHILDILCFADGENGKKIAVDAAGD